MSCNVVSIPVRSIFDGLGDGIIAAAMSGDARFIVLIGCTTPQVKSLCMHVYVHTRVYAYVYAFVCVRVSVLSVCVCVCACVRACVCINIP